MADDKRNLTTPWGEALWPSLDREEVIAGKPTGKLSIKLVLSGPALETMKAEVESFIADTFPAKKAKTVVRPFKEKDGKVFLTFTTYAYEKDDKTKKRRVQLFDAKGNLVRREVSLGNGSIVRIKTTIEPTEYQGKDYVKFWLNAIQIKKLVEYVPGGGFDAVDDEDGGWTEDEFASDPDANSDVPDEGSYGAHDEPADEPAEKPAPAARKGRAKSADF
jgi:hypothetical protein